MVVFINECLLYLQAHEVYTEAGIRGFWKGLVPTLIMVINNYSSKAHEYCNKTYIKIDENDVTGVQSIDSVHDIRDIFEVLEI